MAYLPEVRGAVDAANSSTAPLGVGATFTGSFVDVALYDSISVIIEGTSASVAPGTLHMQFSQNGTTVDRDIVIAVTDVAGTPPRTLGVIAQYFRVVYTNGAVAQITFDIQAMQHPGFVRLVSRLDQSVGEDEDVQNVRAFLGGLDVLAAAFKNVSVASSTNSAGTYNALQVASGARPSQLPGRTPIQIVANADTAPTLQYTVTATKTLYITDIVITVENSANTLGRLEVYDALSATGTPVLPIFVPDPGAGSTTVSTVQHTFAEPLAFTIGVFWDEAGGTLTMSGVMLGYEE